MNVLYIFFVSNGMYKITWYIQYTLNHSILKLFTCVSMCVCLRERTPQVCAKYWVVLRCFICFWIGFGIGLVWLIWLELIACSTHSPKVSVVFNIYVRVRDTYIHFVWHWKPWIQSTYALMQHTPLHTISILSEQDSEIFCDVQMNEWTESTAINMKTKYFVVIVSGAVTDEELNVVSLISFYLERFWYSFSQFDVSIFIDCRFHYNAWNFWCLVEQASLPDAHKPSQAISSI